MVVGGGQVCWSIANCNLGSTQLEEALRRPSVGVTGRSPATQNNEKASSNFEQTCLIIRNVDQYSTNLVYRSTIRRRYTDWSHSLTRSRHSRFRCGCLSYRQPMIHGCHLHSDLKVNNAILVLESFEFSDNDDAWIDVNCARRASNIIMTRHLDDHRV